jgi:cobalt-zinc-cadmium efflux system membrane fusion protein
MVAAGTLFAAGCGQEVKKVENHARPATEKKADDHSGWWCEEHGVPEAICGQCNARVAAELKKKGDWCKTHDRPDSQCFVCHPEKEAEFARQYEAKYGKNPPKPQEEPKKDG